MAIPTQFSVTKKAKCPIANPDAAQDLANVISAESIGFISGASALPSKAPSETGSAVVIDSEDLPEQGGAVMVNSQSPSTQDGASILPVIAQPSIDNASAATTQNAPAFSVPSAITSKTGTLITPPFPLNHARILYRNKLENYQSVVSDVASNALNALKRNTWEKWTPSGEGYFKATMQFDIGVDAIAIGAHNLGTKGYTVEAFYRESAAGPLIPFGTSKTPSDDTPIMWHLPFDTLMRVVEIYISGSTGAAEIGYISAGKVLQMQRPFFNGHNPFDDSDVTEYYAKRTESGERIGRDIRRKGFETSFEWSNLDDEWYRNYIPEFKQYAKINPIFVAWNLLEYPNDVAFGETTDDMKASMQNGTRIKRDGFGFTLVGV